MECGDEEDENSNAPPEISSSQIKMTAPPPPARNHPNAAAPAKIISQNYNGTVVVTSSPENEAELQLYRVMQRASLLSYYDTLLEMGGDDVQQLCDAGETEFLEIMALVGMASKPLHVRRFQKALQEWLGNPGMFRTPIIPGNGNAVGPLSVPSITSSPMSCPSLFRSISGGSSGHLPDFTVTPASSPNMQQMGEITSCTPAASASPIPSSSPAPESPSPLSTNPALTEAQIRRLEDAAQKLAKSLPELEPKVNSAKKKVGKELQAVLNMSEDDPQRLNMIRKFSAIYGRFDCKRKAEKPLTPHEVSVNEAAAQICKFIPALLTRRDELFPLARQVVRLSGYHYSKGHSKSSGINLLSFRACASHYEARLEQNQVGKNAKKRHFSSKNEEKLNNLRENIADIESKMDDLRDEYGSGTEGNAEYGNLKSQVDSLQDEKTQLLRNNKQNARQIFRRKKSRRIKSKRQSNTDSEEEDSSHSSTEYSSSTEDEEESRRGPHNAPLQEKLSPVVKLEQEDDYEDSIQVIAARGNNIIAVTNPALPRNLKNKRNNK